MIFKVWVKIFLIIFCASVPLIWIQYLSQRESLELAFEMTEKVSPQQVLESHLQLLKRVSKLDPQNSNQYKKEFESALEHKFVKQDFQIIKDQLVRNLLKETLRNAALVLGFFLVLSFLISRNLVLSFQKLLNQIQSQASRLERLNSIESWQKIARVLVHELRSPITPIKLVATDIENKYENLQASQFKYYLHEGARLIQSQIRAIENLLGSFTQFAKLPEIKKSHCSILKVLNDFAQHYNGYSPSGLSQGQTQLKVVVINCIQECLFIDAEALRHLFFNLMKNASEANSDSQVEMILSVKQDEKRTWIRVQNTGKKIPDEIADQIFDLHFSSKKGLESPNLGIGLTIARKIALDHNGDLYLVANAQDQVTFELELPNL